MTRTLQETTPLGEAKVGPSGRMRVHAITAGLGSSGYYSPEVLQEAATNGLIAKGTPLFLDHPSETDRHDRPERSVKDIAAVFTEAATYDATAKALVGEIQVFAPYRDLLTEMAPYIGLSISGSATDVTEGNIDGKRVPVIEGLAKIDSVDWVTRAGRGGKVVELIESARFIHEATASDRAQQLSDAVRAAHGGDGVYVWVRDQDAEAKTVWFEISKRDEDGSKTYEQTYVVADNDVDVSLTGDPVEVRRRTDYVPVNNPTEVPATRPDSTTTTESQKETPMGMKEIEESEHTRLTEAAGRVDVLESENTTLKAENDQLKESIAANACGTRAKTLIGESEHVFTPLEARALLADLPVVEADGVKVLDETAFTERLTEASKESAATLGAKVGVHGFGASTSTDTQVAESGPTTSPWGRPLAEQNGA
jgi:hypothetical protein